jgi:hypothetical protein
MTPEVQAAYDELTAAIEKVMALTGVPRGVDVEGDPVMALDYLVVVFGKNMRLAETKQSSYSYLMKDAGEHMPVHAAQGLAKRLYDWANEDE